jgi:hypothetical protein
MPRESSLCLPALVSFDFIVFSELFPRIETVSFPAARSPMMVDVL